MRYDLMNVEDMLDRCEPEGEAKKATARRARKLCTCDGAGRGPGRACVVKAGGRLGGLWRCAEGAEGADQTQATKP